MKSGKFSVTVTTRKDSSATFPDQVKVEKTDYSDSSLAQIFQGQDAVVSAITGGALSEQHKIIDAAVKAGVKRFLPSEFGTDTTNKNGRDICPVFTAKMDVIDRLEAKARENSNFSWTAVATGLFFGKVSPQRAVMQGGSRLSADRNRMELDFCLRSAFLGIDLKAQTANIWGSGDQRWSTTNVETVGKSVVGVLERPAETKNRFVWVESFSTSQNDVVAALEKTTGKRWQVNKVKTADQIKTGNELVAKGESAGIALLIIGAIFTEDVDTGADFSKSRKIDNDLLGLPKEDLQTTIQEIVKDFS